MESPITDAAAFGAVDVAASPAGVWQLTRGLGATRQTLTVIRDGAVVDVVDDASGIPKVVSHRLGGVGEAKRFVAEQLSRWIRVGFTLSPTDARVEVEPREPRLEQMIRDAPDQVESYLVYADWLSGRGSPRGELAVLQHALETRPSPQLRRVELALRAANRDLLVGDLARFGPQLRVGWRLGWIERAVLTLGRSRRGDASAVLDEALAELLAHPSAAFLRHLALEDVASTRPVYQAALDRLAEAGGPPTLATLRIGCEAPLGRGLFDYSEVEPAVIGTLEPLSRAHPRLRDVELCGDAILLGEAVFPELRRLSIRCQRMSPALIDLVRPQRFPELEQLELAVGASGGAEQSAALLAAVARLLEDTGWPDLRRLALRQLSSPAPAIAALCRSQLLGRLTHVSFAGCELDDAAIAALVGAGEQLAHLERLELVSSRGAVGASEQLLEPMHPLRRICREVALGRPWEVPGPPAELSGLDGVDQRVWVDYDPTD